MNIPIRTSKKRKKLIKSALAGNRTRAARVAGEHSTTEPPVLLFWSISFSSIKLQKWNTIKK
jgi:hypothetical protein